MRSVLCWGALGLLLTSASTTPAATLRDSFQFGKHWYGPDLTHEDLTGRVVLIENWGMR